MRETYSKSSKYGQFNRADLRYT